MCDICDGMTIAQVLAREAWNIEEHGFWMTEVQAEPGWVYTVGLSAAGHPELVVAGAKVKTALAVLSRLANRVLDGEVLQGYVADENVTFGLRPVHDAQLRHGLCASWTEYTRFFEPPWAPLAALQVLLPPAWFCPECRRHQPRLDLPRLWPWMPTRRRAN